VSIDSQDKMFGMKKSLPPTRAGLEKHYDRLRQKLARTGYISRGSVLARSVATSGRSGYQWTRKVAGKTVSVSLSQEQFEAMKQAVSNQRELWRTIEQMEKVSRQLLFQTTADTRRRKPLGKNVLGTI
jgi:type II secretory pathway component PulJ